MSFIKKLDNSSSYRTNTKTVVINNQAYSAVSDSYSSIILSKTDASGGIFWKKKISIQNNSLIVRELLKFPNNELLLVVSNTNFKVTILRLTLSGDIVYQRTCFLNDYYLSDVKKVCILDNNEFCIVTENDTFLFFDSQGNLKDNLGKKLLIVAGLRPPYPELSVTDVVFRNSQLVIVGTATLYSSSSFITSIPISNFNSNVYFFGENSTRINQVFVNPNNNIVLCGSHNGKPYFTAEFNIGNNILLVLSANNVEGYLSSFTYNRNLNCFYFYKYSNVLLREAELPNLQNSFSKVTSGFNRLWSKTLNIGGSIQELKLETTDNTIVLNSKSYNERLWGVLDSEFSLCKTSSTVEESFSPASFLIDTNRPRQVYFGTLNREYYMLPNFTLIFSDPTGADQDICTVNYLSVIGSSLGKLFFDTQTNYNNAYVGNIQIRNSASFQVTINSGVIATKNGLSFIIEGGNIGANSDRSFKVYVTGQTSQIGDNFSAPINISNPEVSNPSGYSITFNVEQGIAEPNVGCEANIAIVVEETSSNIYPTSDYINRLKSKLRHFITNQANSNITLSLIGMSNGINDIRTDHIIEKNIKNNKQLFLDWIDNYGLRIGVGIDNRSDYLASGLEAVKNKLSGNPDIVIVIAKGCENDTYDYVDKIQNTIKIKTLYTEINSKSHIFQYGYNAGSYDFGVVNDYFVPALQALLDRTPIQKTTQNNILTSDYIGFDIIDNWASGLGRLSQDIYDSQVGCYARLEILNDVVINSLVAGTIYDDKPVGFINIRNKSNSPYTLYKVQIHGSTNIAGGLVFTATGTIQANSLENAIEVRVSGMANYSLSNFVESLVMTGSGAVFYNPSPGFNLKINVAEETIRGTITHSDIPNEVFIKDLLASYHGNYGEFIVKNETKTQSLKIQNGLELFSNQDFVFTVHNPANEDYVIDPLNSQTIYINLNVNSIPRIAGEFKKTIGIPKVRNLTHKIIFRVEPEDMVAEIIQTEFYPDLTYVKDYPFTTARDVGDIIVQNNTQTLELFIPKGKPILNDIDGRGLDFKVREDVKISYGQNGRVPIIVTSEGGANQLGSFAPVIEFSGLQIENPHEDFLLPFTIEQDIVDVQLVYAVFDDFPTMIKGQAITGDLTVGEITILNNSLVTPYILNALTKIYDQKLSGLEFITANTEDIEIRAGEEYSVGIKIKPTNVTPTDYGHFSGLIKIDGVYNPEWEISFNVFDNGISVETNEGLELQSPNFALQAVGSKGRDSIKGVHLRWLFSGNLGDKHLPKGQHQNGDESFFNYNKADDYVKLYRVPYTSQIRAICKIDLTLPPAVLDDAKQCWIYEVSGDISSGNNTPSRVEVESRLMYVYFTNKQTYNQLRQNSPNLNPLTNPKGFIDAYGNNIIEIECKNELFFRVTPKPRGLSQGKLSLEVLSVEENKLVVNKYLSYRRKMTIFEISQSQVFVENGRSIRYQSEGYRNYIFEFEFYSDFIASASNWKSWQEYGVYSLTTTTNSKMLNNRLVGNININFNRDKWLKYNNDEYVNWSNYINRWKTPIAGNNPLNSSILQIVEKYLLLSGQDETNPRAIEYLNINFADKDQDDDGEFDPEEPGEDNGATSVSYLDLLNVAAMDYHIARLLGLGTLDRQPDNGLEYIYLTEYKTLRDPQDESLEKECQLLSMSLPTSINTERLPLPIEINELYKGVPRPQNEDIPVLYDEEGYSLDGRNRFISIINKPIPSAQSDPDFFPNDSYWNASLYTLPVHAGLEYRMAMHGEWLKPELSHSDDYYSLNLAGTQSNLETIPILLPENFGDPLFVHRQTESGDYAYCTYGINIFSRATYSTNEFSIKTEIKPLNSLLPPSDIKTWLIQPEKPLMFTSQFEQDRYNEIEDEDKTFVRINFGYNSNQDMVIHPIPFDSNVSDTEYENNTNYFKDIYDIFADHLEVYFRKDTPKKISASLYYVEDDDEGDNLCAVFKTKPYYVVSTDEIFNSVYPPDTTSANFVGAVFLVNNKSYVVKKVRPGIGSDVGLRFTVYKEEVSATILSGGSISVHSGTLKLPETSGNDLFVVTENMQTENVWGQKNPNSFKIPLKFPLIYREVITSISEKGQEQKYLEKSRGFWESASISLIDDGVYKIIFDDLKLDQEILQTVKAFLEINNGVVRLFRQDSFNGGRPTKSRDQFKVIKAENFGLRNRRPFTLYIYDELRENASLEDNISEIITGDGIIVNYYPSYNLYLYNDVLNDLIKENVLPTNDSNLKYSIFGMRTVETVYNYKSRFSAPSIMLGQKIIAPMTPEAPIGSLYATRPDFYGRSTYSFTTIFNQKPFGVQFCRADNDIILNALYKTETVANIYQNLALLGGNNEEFLTNRWNNFFDFQFYRYDQPAIPGEDPALHERYKEFPEIITEDIKLPDHIEQEAEEQTSDKISNEEILPYRFPLPDNDLFFEGINRFIESYNATNHQSIPLIPNSSFGVVLLNHKIIEPLIGVNDEPFYLIDFIQDVIENTFVPLTEVPILYQHVKKAEYTPDPKKNHFPVDKKQNIRDASGFLLKPPADPNKDDIFDMAPMMTILSENGNQKKVLFTDFTLNGTTNNLYFYASREIGSQMNLGDMSTILGPVKLINSNPAEPPKILSGLPILENKVLGINPKIKIVINSYPEFIGIKRINLYRTNNRLDAESILSMKNVKQIEISDLEVTEEAIWTAYDELSDFEEIPYGDVLYYRVVVEKQVEYAEYDNGVATVKIDYVPSQASKILALALAENRNPESPSLKGVGTRPKDEDFVNNVMLHWNVTCYKGIYHLYSMSVQGNWKEIARFTTNGTNDRVQLQVYNSNATNPQDTWLDVTTLDIIDSKITLNLGLLGSSYNQFPLFDENNNRKYYHFKIIAENTSSMFSNQDNILTLFTDEVWDNLPGISTDGVEGMIIDKTFIIK